MDIVFATRNKNKIEEAKKIINNCNFNLIPVKETGIDIDILEDGNTYEENALKKAKTIMEIIKKPVISDDSGIEIDFLDKKPGVDSANFLGKNTSYIDRNNYILDALKNAKGKERNARYICVIALVSPKKNPLIVKATLEGSIAFETKGKNGFGYDPIFFLKEYNMTASELEKDIKNKISHRAKALKMMNELILKSNYFDL